jgi:hypothetical protein
VCSPHDVTITSLKSNFFNETLKVLFKSLLVRKSLSTTYLNYLGHLYGKNQKKRTKKFQLQRKSCIKQSKKHFHVEKLFLCISQKCYIYIYNLFNIFLCKKKF